jgi:hypothetical protein
LDWQRREDETFQEKRKLLMAKLVNLANGFEGYRAQP